VTFPYFNLFILIKKNFFRWNARIKKLEKDIERYKLDSTQMSEKYEQLIKEKETLKSQNLTLKEQNTKTETDLNEGNVCKLYKKISLQIIHFRQITND
jgi:hypothetical protein